MSQPRHVVRNEEVDILRGLSMFIMVFLHTGAYFLSISFVFTLWNYGEFAVPIFIFCSSYIFFSKKYTLNTWKDFVIHVKKRLARLLIPYYFFVIVYLLLEKFKDPSKITFQYLFQNALAIGGISLNWLVLLFVFFTFLMPLLLYLYTKKRALYYFYFFLAIVCSLILVFFSFPFNYRFIMWLPWSLIVIFSFSVARDEHKKWFFLSSFVIWFIVFLLLWCIQVALHHSLTMYDNKYPPNLYHLSFGIFSIIAIYTLTKRGLFSIPYIKDFLFFLSRNSYPLFFVHWVVIYIITVFFHLTFNWIVFFVVVLLLSVFIQLLLNFLVNEGGKKLPFFNVK